MLGALNLLGADGRELKAVLAQPKRVALLAYLAAATPRRLHRRDSLLALLWPELDQEHARAALRQALHGLRHSLGADAFESRGDEEVGVDDRTFWCDVTAFNRAIDAGRQSEALELYRGDLLDGFFISGAPELERWIEDERTRLRRRACETGWTLADSCRAAGDHALAAHWARRAATLSRDDESALRRLIALLDQLGDRAGAVQAYDAFARRLAQDAEVEPAAETRALIAAVRSRETTRDVSAAVPVVKATPAWRTEDRRARHALVPDKWSIVRPAVIAAGVAALIGAVAVVAFMRAGTSRLDAHRVVVVPLANRTGDRTLNPVGELAADWITRGLAETGLVEVADPGRARFEREDSADAPRGGTPDLPGPDAASRARALAVETESGTAVWGSFYRRGDSLEFAAQITDERRGKLLRSIAPVVGDAREPRAAIATLGERVAAGLAAVLDPKLGEWTSLASQPPSYEAYLAFAAGADAWERFDGREALRDLYRAASLDSTYTLPLVWAAGVHRYLGECEKTDSIAHLLRDGHARPARLDQYFLEKEVARCRGDRAAVYRAARRMYEALPGSEYLAEQAGREALAIHRPREALGLLENLHPHRGALEGRTSYYLWLTAAYHLLGDHERELKAAQRARRQYPNNLATLRHELLALAALRRLPEISQRLDEIPAMPPHGYQQPAAVVRETALELDAHGSRVTSRDVLQRAIAWLDSRPSEEQATEASRFERLSTLYAAARWDAARALAEQLVKERPNNVTYQGLRGALAAVQGDRRAAERADSVLAVSRRPFLRGVATYWRACIAAQLGDRARAVTLLIQADAEGLPFRLQRWLHADPSLQGLRDYPPLQELLKPKG